MEGTPTNSTEPGRRGEEKVCVEKSNKNGSPYSETRIVAEEPKDEVMEIITESKETKKVSKYLKQTIPVEEATEVSQNNYSNVSTLHRDSQQVIPARITTETGTATTKASQHHRAHPKHKQMDTRTSAPNKELTSTSAATDTSNTHDATPRTGEQHMQHRDKKHDTNNNSTRPATKTKDTEVKTDTHPLLKGTKIAAKGPRRRNTTTASGTADDSATRHRGGEKATREELKRKDDIEVSPVQSYIVFITIQFNNTYTIGSK